MVNVNEVFPSKYLTAEDLQSRDHRLTISDVASETFDGQPGKPASTKLVVFFKGKKKGFVMNKTNSRTLADAYGPETDDWRGQDVIVFPTFVDFQGRQVAAIRCRVPTARDNRAA